MLVRKKKYDLLNREYLLLNDKHERLKCKYEKSWLKNKEYKAKILELENNNEAFRIERGSFEDRIKALNQEIDLYVKTLSELEEENKKLKEDNKDFKEANNLLSKVLKDINSRLWMNEESKRQLRKLAREILDSDKINKNYVASYLYEISLYINAGFKAKKKIKEEK